MGAAEEFQVLSPELRNKARRYRDSRCRQDATTSTNRRSLILGTVNDILAGTYHGSATDNQTGIEEDLLLKGLDGGGSMHSTRSNRTRYQRRGSCTKYNLEKISNHSTHKSPQKIRREVIRSSLGAKATPGMTSPQHTIDERPLPMKNSTHRRRLKDVKASMQMESSEHDDMSIVSAGSFCDDTVGSERSHRTIDELPLPMKEIKTSKTPAAPRTPSGRSRQTPWQTPRSPGALSISTSTKHRSPGSLTCQRKIRRSVTTANGQHQQSAAAVVSMVPVSPLRFDDDVLVSPLSAMMHDGSSSSFSDELCMASPPTKKIRSPKSSSGRKKVVKSSTKSSSSRRKVSKATNLPTDLPLGGAEETDGPPPSLSSNSKKPKKKVINIGNSNRR